jgi:hypothetical protein
MSSFISNHNNWKSEYNAYLSHLVLRHTALGGRGGSTDGGGEGGSRGDVMVVVVMMN